MSNGIQSDVAFQRTGGPRADAAFGSKAYPLGATADATVQGGLEDDVSGADGVEQLPFLFGRVNADEFFIECDGHSR